ncbi:hypothetical protein AB0940_18985 [Streptomyces sp. NPDC006656]|uniref:hypothetical protein n=1 Tax=Streptomyces sp. NPDC006656 TaxID=3156899 RepID=UPI00345409DA
MMRPRAMASAAACALTLLLAAPAPASAAQGDFTYAYNDANGMQYGSLMNPKSKTCITIPQVADPNSTEPAFSPNNETDKSASVYLNPDCTGSRFSLKAKSRLASRVKFRSVKFA